MLLLARAGYSIDQLDDLLEKRSGLAGMSGLGSDFRAIEAAAARGDGSAQLAIDVFVHRIRKYVGAYAAELGGADAIAFAGGIGEHSALVRERCARRSASWASSSSRTQPRGAAGARRRDRCRRRACAPTKVLVVHTDEEQMIARATWPAARSSDQRCCIIAAISV